MPIRFLASLLLAVSLLGAADQSLPPASSSAAIELAALKALATERPPASATGVKPTFSESLRWNSDHAARVAEAAVKFYESHHADPIRWEGAALALKTNRGFIIDLKPGLDEAVAAKDSARVQSLIVRDTAAREAWLKRLDALQAELLSASDVPADLLGQAYADAIYRVTLRPGASMAEKQAAMLLLLGGMEARVSDTKLLIRAYEMTSRIMQTADAAGYTEMLQRLAQSTQPEIAQWAVGKGNVQTAKAVAVEMKFTAVDGREVDLAKLRGKVVLIDFWATWCGPCKEELPNVRGNYEKYHDRGFEVVAVSLDNQKDKQKLIDYCRDHDLPWPQHFDGQGWKNEFAAKFSIRAIPAMFLIDQTGKVVATDARGPKLEAEIKRLLKL